MTEEALFELALKTPEAARGELLDRECAGNAELRARVEALIAADATVGPAPTATAPTTPDEQGVILAGKYKLIERIGEGGMGSVWVAHQSEPVKRKVAVKLIKAGMDSKQVLARFEAERQALAVMDHPNIAKVLDGGLTPDGRPFFVMELVKGVPITEYCDRNKLTPKQRLELFVPVCQAIQHAHQKGIIHRDIKPSNVLIALYDDKPVPKVIDFGIAKATGGTLTEQTIETAFGGVVGTPQYMSPEQASLNNLDIDTRSDVYSLGVLLYELLTGSPPFARKELQKAGLLEILRVVREEEPPRPSNKLSTADALPSLSASRGTEPKKLTGLLRNELDWIVMKALEKDRTRRYETANGFAADVNRYLSGEAVQAHPPSTAYRVKKFVRRNRVQVIAASLVLVALVAGIAGTTYGLIRSEEQRHLAEARKQEADASALSESEQRRKAEKAEADTLADYRASTDDAIEQLIGSKPELGPKEKSYLENTVKRWKVFAARQGDDEMSRSIRAEGHSRVGQIWARLGRNEESQMECQSAQIILKRLVDQNPAVSKYKVQLASCHSSLGYALNAKGKHELAYAEVVIARDIQMKLVLEFPADGFYQANLGHTRNLMACIYGARGKPEESLTEFKAARDIQQSVVKQYPAVPGYQLSLAYIHNNIGAILLARGRFEEARVEHQAAFDLTKKLAGQFPSNPEYKAVLANGHDQLGRLFGHLGKRPEELQEYRASQRINKSLVEQFPSVPVYQVNFAGGHFMIGFVLSVLGEDEEARSELMIARKIQASLVQQFPAVVIYQSELCKTHSALAVLLVRLGKPSEAEEEYRSAMAIHEKLVTDYPAVPAYRVELGGSYISFGRLVSNGGKPAESLPWFQKAIDTLRPVHVADPRDETAKTNLRLSHWNRAVTFDRLQKFAEAVKDWDRAIELSPPADQVGLRASRATSRLQAGMVAEAVAEVAELTKSSNWNAGEWYDFACVYAVASGKIADKKQEYADRAMELLQQAVKAGFKDAANMKRDTDLDSLRERDDFKKLLESFPKPKE